MREHDPVGSAAEEAAKLIGAVSEWARDLGSSIGGNLGSGIEEHLATGAPECTYCPLCRTVHIVREASPEVKTHLAEAAAALMQAAAGVLAAAGSGWGTSARRSGSVQHIDLDDDQAQQWPDEPEGN